MIDRAALAALFLWFSAANATDLLHPSLAFRPSATLTEARTLNLRFDISDNYYLYRDKFVFETARAEIRLGAPVFPAGKKKRDENFGDVEAYYHEVVIRIPVDSLSPAETPFTLEVTSQGCAEQLGVCFPPQKHRLEITLPAMPRPDREQPLLADDESSRAAALIKSSSVWLTAVSFFGFGLLLSLTPCVFPMIPIVSGIIVGARRNAGNLPRSTGFALACAYVFGMAVTYAAAGVAAGLSGMLLANALQTLWARGAFALVFVALGLSMFGIYTLQLPAFLQTFVASGASRIRGRSLGGVAAMGAISALIVAPCVAPPLAGALLYLGQAGNALLGGLALFCLALGMGVPLLAVGALSGKCLPSSGPWMNTISRIFGFVLLGVAHWLLTPFLPPVVQMLAWGVLLIALAIDLDTHSPVSARFSLATDLPKIAALLFLLSGVAFLSGAFMGAPDPYRPLSWLSGNGRSALRVTRVRSLAELNEQIEMSKQPVMLDFYADWCVACKAMERDTFSEAKVQKALERYRVVQADVTANTDADQALLARFGLFGPPAILLFDPAGNEKARVVGFQDAARFLETLEAARP